VGLKLLVERLEDNQAFYSYEGAESLRLLQDDTSHVEELVVALDDPLV
jgi:hypothetical protein